MSIRRPARVYPTRSRRCRSDTEAVCVCTTTSIARSRSGSSSGSKSSSPSSSPMGASGASSSDSSRSCPRWARDCSTTSAISSSVTYAPCSRCSREVPSGLKSMSPWPRRLSAPAVSRITRESVWLETANAIREGTLALIIPVITSTDGRWVASTRWMPTARDFWASRITQFSTACGDTIIRSASSSMTTRR